MRNRTLVPLLRGLSLAAAACFLTAETCQKDVGEGDQPGVYTVRASVDSAGGQVFTPTLPGNGNQNSSLSADGRFVAFQSDSPQLVTGDGNGFQDVFVKDRTNGAVVMVSINTQFGSASDNNSANPSLSSDGTVVAFESSGNLGGTPTAVAGDFQLFVHDTKPPRATRAVFDAGPAVGASMIKPSLSGDGTRVAFISQATNLTAGTFTGNFQVFVADLSTSPSTIRLVSHAFGAATTGCNGDCDSPKISRDGSLVVFSSVATNLVSPASTAVARVYSGLPDGSADCDMVSRTTAGVYADGLCQFPTISGDGRFVAFRTSAPNLLGANPAGQIAYRDRIAPSTTLISFDSAGGPIQGSTTPSISADGQFVAFVARPTGPIGGFNQIWVKDTLGGIRYASLHLSGAFADNACNAPSMSADGRWVSWHTLATNLVTTDTNGQNDVFIRGPLR
jgi:Tol biopolymer transport system component